MPVSSDDYAEEGLYYARDGTPITSRHEFSVLFGNRVYRRVALTEIDSSARVSTVWLGINHGMSKERPLIFETMSNEDDEWVECRRYSTEEEALKGHAEVVALVAARRSASPNNPFLRKVEIDE